MVDLADILRAEASKYLQERFVTPVQRRAVWDIVRCRTASMGSAPVRCDRCGVEYRLFRSCRNRSCPQCQSEARTKWLEARQQEILPCPYLHVVFSTPAVLNVLAQYCPVVFYDAVIRAAGQAIVDVGWSKLHAQLGCQVHLQTWTQRMALHPHAHCVVPCGGFSADGRRWIAFKPADLPKKTLSKRFRSLLCQRVREAVRRGKLDNLPETLSVEALLRAAIAGDWRVYSEPPFGGPEKLLEYLARYTYRVAITNDRIEAYENDQVTFLCRNSRDPRSAMACTLGAQEFVRRFLTHVPPRGFVRMRSYGFMSNRGRKENIIRARQLIGRATTPVERKPFTPMRLCPACSGRDEQTLHIAVSSSAPPQMTLLLRPPPSREAIA